MPVVMPAVMQHPRVHLRKPNRSTQTDFDSFRRYVFWAVDNALVYTSCILRGATLDGRKREFIVECKGCEKERAINYDSFLRIQAYTISGSCKSCTIRLANQRREGR